MSAPTGTSIGERPTRVTTDPAERAAWLQLATTPGIGSRRIANLLQHFGSARAILDAPPAALTEVELISHAIARAIRQNAGDRGEALLRQANAAGQQVLVPSDCDYPAQLRSIPDPPPILFALGDLAVLHRPSIAIIGSRNHTRYGAEVASRLGHVASEAGLVVVSGMARGLDAIAQGATLDASGTTVAVFGSGVDVVYPAQNRRLHDRILRSGALLSESPPGTLPRPGAFPRRNRIISGLAQAVVVVEAANNSGTLITVECALEQGRDVLAVPGPISSPTSAGTNRLIRDGATPVLSVEDLPLLLGLGPNRTEPRPINCDLSPEEARVYHNLTNEPCHIDELALNVGLPIGTMLGVLLGLELGGLVDQLPGSSFRRSGK